MPLFNTILDFIFPSKCLACGEEGEDLCLACLSAFPPAERESKKWIFALYDYRHPSVKGAIWLLKYKGRKRLAKALAGALYPRLLEELADLEIMENFREPLLIPVPLSGKRKRERGFNQAELLAEELLALDGENKNFKLEKKILVKPEDTKHQARIENRSERMKNVIGMFRVKHAEKIRGRNIILLDDVTTTGATLSEAKKVLENAGARKVVAFTVAH